jgi:polyhydroxybutyrate depolymerase
MKKLVTTLLIASVFCLTSCAAKRERREAERSGQSSISHQLATIQIGGLSRSFRWVVPSSVAVGQRLPVVVLLHGGGGTGSKVGGMTQSAGGFDAFADQKGFLAIYPDAASGNWNDGRETIPHKNDDVGFILAAVDHVSKIYATDPNRIFVAGISNGGMMAQRMACDASQKISAIAVVAATMPSALVGRCKSATAVPALFIIGEADPLVPFLGGQVKSGIGGDMLSAANTISFWANKNAAAFESSKSLADLDPNDGTRTVVEKYQTQGRTSVVFYKIAGGGHTWPGGTELVPQRLVGLVAKDFSANQMIWEFFAAR